MSIGKLAPYLLFAAALVGAAVLLRPEPPPAARTAPADLQPDSMPAARTAPATARGVAAQPTTTRDLESRLEREIAARRALERQVDALAAELAELRASLAATASGEPPADARASADPFDRREWFDEQALVDAGIDALQTESLRRFFEELELERLTLRDRARREDWRNGELRMALQTIDNREQELQQQLGDAAYDAYLYATGRPNRLVVTSVLASAPAGQAGIVSGDRIISYDNQRIYNWRDLRDAMSGGSISDTIEVEVERDGGSLQFYLARGPLGVRTDSQSLAP